MGIETMILHESNKECVFYSGSLNLALAQIGIELVVNGKQIIITRVIANLDDSFAPLVILAKEIKI